MKDPGIVRANARINAASTLLMNLSGALIAADVYRLFVEQRVDLTSAAWTFVVAALIFSGLKILDLLEAEAE